MRRYLIDTRIKKGYSQRKVARDAGVSYQHYSMIENGERGGKVSFLVIARIARVLDIPLEELFIKEEAYQESLDFKAERTKRSDKTTNN